MVPPRPDPSVTGLVVRPAGVGDVAALHALDAAGFDPSWSTATWHEEVRRVDRAWLVAQAQVPATAGTGVDRHGGPVVGMGGLWLAPDEAHVLRLSVADGHRGRGVGRRLVAALVEVADERGRDAVTLEVRASNAPALRLYRHVGFEIHGVRPGYYPDGEDAVVLWWRSVTATTAAEGR